MSLQKICMACINIDATCACELQLCSMMICSSTTPRTLQPLLFRSRRSAQHGQFPWPVADRCYSLPVYGVCGVSAGFTTQRANDVEPYFTETNLIGSDLCLSLDAPLIYDRDRCADLCILPGFGVVGEGTMSSWWLCFVRDVVVDGGKVLRFLARVRGDFFCARSCAQDLLFGSVKSKHLSQL